MSVRMIVANIYSLPNGVAVSGRIEIGKVSIGDKLIISTSGGDRKVGVMFIEKFQSSLEFATIESGLVAITLDSIERDMVSNRDVLHD